MLDPRCEEYKTALRALYILFLRRKFDLLKEVGLEDVEPLQVWRLTSSDLKTDDEIWRLLNFYPELVGSMILLVGRYQIKMKGRE